MTRATRSIPPLCPPALCTLYSHSTRHPRTGEDIWWVFIFDDLSNGGCHNRLLGRGKSLDGRGFAVRKKLQILPSGSHGRQRGGIKS